MATKILHFFDIHKKICIFRADFIVSAFLPHFCGSVISRSSLGLLSVIGRSSGQSSVAERAREYAKINLLLAALELAEEADVVLGEETEVFDTIFEVRDTLYTHTERIAGIDFRINTTSLQHIRIHHTATEDLNPSGSLAERAAFAATDIT